ncbi:MAG: YicC family protein [Candidatus Hydrogenedentes bacterium]|nr:YicC family protein [Candidatus Hydrogenedentota bacterium]
MTRSMTGFGRVSADIDNESVTIEVSTVNHRFLECTFRMPSVWAALETPLRNLVKDALSRGKLNVSIRRSRGPMGRPAIHFDAENAKQYIDASKELARLMNSTGAMSLDVLAQMEGVFYQEEQEQDLDAVKDPLCAAFVEALNQLNQSRAEEGESLARDVAARITEMQDALSIIEGMLPDLAQAYEERLRARVNELNVDVGLTQERLAIEIALMADKMDVNEEVVRLKSHFEKVLSLLRQKEPIGRDLNFLSQELQREINTLGSKMRDLDVTREVLRLKAELEKLREQAQNIE